MRLLLYKLISPKLTYLKEWIVLQDLRVSKYIWEQENK